MIKWTVSIRAAKVWQFPPPSNSLLTKTSKRSCHDRRNRVPAESRKKKKEQPPFTDNDNDDVIAELEYRVTACPKKKRSPAWRKKVLIGFGNQVPAGDDKKKEKKNNLPRRPRNFPQVGFGRLGLLVNENDFPTKIAQPGRNEKLLWGQQPVGKFSHILERFFFSFLVEEKTFRNYLNFELVGSLEWGSCVRVVKVKF